jgi:hypothetical protein
VVSLPAGINKGQQLQSPRAEASLLGGDQHRASAAAAAAAAAATKTKGAATGAPEQHTGPSRPEQLALPEAVDGSKLSGLKAK